MNQGVQAMKRTGIAAMLWVVTLCMLPGMALAADAAADKKAAPAPAAANESLIPEHAVQPIMAPDIDIAALRDPFESYLTVLEQQNQKRMQAHRSRTSDRAAQPLESFDLGALKLVAIMKMGDAHAAMVEDPEGKGYVVRTGTYIGRDNGRVVKISERSVEIMEDEFTATGEIARRKATLTLNEVNSR